MNYPRPELITILKTTLLLEAAGVKEHPAPWLKNAKQVLRGPGGRFASKGGGGGDDEPQLSKREKRQAVQEAVDEWAEKLDFPVSDREKRKLAKSLRDGSEEAFAKIDAAMAKRAKRLPPEYQEVLEESREAMREFYEEEMKPLIDKHMEEALEGKTAQEIQKSLINKGQSMLQQAEGIEEEVKAISKDVEKAQKDESFRKRFAKAFKERTKGVWGKLAMAAVGGALVGAALAFAAPATAVTAIAGLGMAAYMPLTATGGVSVTGALIGGALAGATVATNYVGYQSTMVGPLADSMFGNPESETGQRVKEISTHVISVGLSFISPMIGSLISTAGLAFAPIDSPENKASDEKVADVAKTVDKETKAAAQDVLSESEQAVLKELGFSSLPKSKKQLWKAYEKMLREWAEERDIDLDDPDLQDTVPALKKVMETQAEMRSLFSKLPD